MPGNERGLAKIRRLLAAYPLCHLCFERQLTSLSLNKSRSSGSKLLQGLAEPPRCFICGGLMSSLDEVVISVRSRLAEYDFNSFQLGTRVDPLMLEREDEMRAKFKLKGGDGIKHHLTRLMGIKIHEVTNRPISSTRPDVEAIVDVKTREVEVKSRPLYGYGRYVKLKRGIHQKSSFSTLEAESVESNLSKGLLETTGGTEVHFTWIGGEDKMSVVLGRGRPFYCRVLNPKVRNIKPATVMKTSADSKVKMVSFKLISSKPPPTPRFTTEVRAYIKPRSPISALQLRELCSFFSGKDVSSTTRRGRRSSVKKVYRLDVEKASTSNITARILCDGGLTIRRLVEGNGEVSPSFSEVLGVELKVDEKKPFDVLKVTVLPRNRFDA